MQLNLKKDLTIDKIQKEMRGDTTLHIYYDSIYMTQCEGNRDTEGNRDIVCNNLVPEDWIVKEYYPVHVSQVRVGHRVLSGMNNPGLFLVTRITEEKGGDFIIHNSDTYMIIDKKMYLTVVKE